MEKHFELLGKPAKDKVTGFTGVVTSLSFDLFGCIQVILNPVINKDGKLGECTWFDVTRIEITDDIPVMPLPDFEAGYVAEGKKGCAMKPTM